MGPLAYLFLGLVFIGPPIAALAVRRISRRFWRTQLSREAESRGLLVVSSCSDSFGHSFPKIRVVSGGPQITVMGVRRGATRHFRLRVFNDQNVEQDVCARVETPPLRGPAVIEWRPPLEDVIRADEPVEPARESGLVMVRSKFGLFGRK